MNEKRSMGYQSVGAECVNGQINNLMLQLLLRQFYHLTFAHLKNLYPFSASPRKWSNTLKQFVGNLPTNCLSVFDHFVILALKGLIYCSLIKCFPNNQIIYFSHQVHPILHQVGPIKVNLTIYTLSLP